jgi:hypothetical protein
MGYLEIFVYTAIVIGWLFYENPVIYSWPYTVSAGA